MKNVLIVVDMQKDFIDMSLGTKEAEAIVPSVVKLIEEGNFDRIYATMDTHEEDYLETFEGKHLPVEHCIRMSEGWKINEAVDEALMKHDAVYLMKPTFGSLELMRRIEEYEPDSITLCGLCTDICVISNAMLLRAALPETQIKIVKDCCAGVTPEKHEAALEVMASCQMDIV